MSGGRFCCLKIKGDNWMEGLKVTEYRCQRVLTTQQIAEAYGTDRKTISYNFNHNIDRFGMEYQGL
jgi:hypothetical protein